MSARDLPPLPWRAYRITTKALEWHHVVGADGRIVFDDLTREAAEILARPDVAALLRGEAVAVPKRDVEWASAMLEAMATQLLTLGKEPSVNWAPLVSRLRAMLAASPFAKEGKE